MTPITKPGLYWLTPEQYHDTEPCAAPSISASGLRRVLACPAKYWWTSTLNPQREQVSTPALSYGKAAHHWILEGDEGFDKRFAVLPEDFNGRTNDGKALRADLEQSGKTVLKHDDFEAIKAMRAAMQEHPFAAAAFANCHVEPSLIWQDEETGVWLRCRPDGLPKAGVHIPDYKTAVSADPEAFGKAVWTYGYHMQAAHYLDGVAAVMGTDPQSFFFVVQEKEPPYVVSVIALSDVALEYGRLQNRAAIRRFADCLSKDRWPGYAEDVVVAELPVWAERQIEDQKERGLYDLYHQPLEAAE